MKLTSLKSFFRAGWRPALGWVGVLGCVRAFVWGAETDTAQLMALIGLCMAHVGIRAFEKVKGQE
jgi:hypothetical protein